MVLTTPCRLSRLLSRATRRYADPRTMTGGNDVQRHRSRQRATIGLAAATLALLAIGTDATSRQEAHRSGRGLRYEHHEKRLTALKPGPPGILHGHRAR